MYRILIAEDELHNREALREVVRRLGHEPTIAQDGQEALELASKMSFDMIFSDVRMPRMSGLEFFDALRTLHENAPPFVFMTAYGQMGEAVAAMRKGALNFLGKPLRKKDIAAAIDEASVLIEARKKSAIGQESASESSFSESAVFVSRAFGEVVQLVDRVSSSLASVLLVGESGTGKEVLARRIHERSGRGGGPFVAFHAGATPESLLESELFGYERGAFTGAEASRLGQIRSAHRGTFFIDELSSMPLAVQAKLLRVLEDRVVQPLGGGESVECDVRWVAATNTALEPLVAQGRFREDLLYRLKVVVIEIPPLRERAEDIPALTRHFVEEMAKRDGRTPLEIGAPTLEVLQSYPWPGNVRELRNVVERAIALSQGSEFSIDLLPNHIAQASRAKEIRLAVGTSLQSAEDRLIEETLLSCNGDKNQAAAILGVAPRTIYRWLERREGIAR